PGGESPTLGVWPGLEERPETVHVVRDWLAKLGLVAAGRGFTTVPASLVTAVPEGVRVLPVRGGPREQRRLLLARLPGPARDPVVQLAQALRTSALAP
ncbi:MAG: LysR family transcriptional regulator, partial [Nonomuraea sp.]|nr:LysR family transcriptional regulator [Nonomuraea sp.]